MHEDMFDRDLFQMSSTYRDMVPDYVFPDLNYLRDDEDDSEDKISLDEKKKRKEAEFEAMKNYVPKIPQTIEELDEDDLYYLEKRRYWKNFYKKHKVLYFIREWFIPRPYYFDGPDYLDKFE